LNSQSETKRIVRNDSESNSVSSGIEALGEDPRLKLHTRLLLNLGSVLLVAVLFLSFRGDNLEHAISDAFFKVRGALTKPPEIVLVGIDDDSFQNLDLQWPWPRRLHAELLASLSAARARVVVFDVLFDTHSKSPDDDRLFSEAIGAHPNVILATARTITKKKAFTKVSWLDPVPTLMTADTSTGSIELLVDPDGAVRRAQLDFEGRPSLGYLAARRFAGKDHGKEIAYHDQTFMINFVGPPGTIPTVSYYQALKPSQFLSQNTFKDKLVFIGSMAGLSSDPNRPDHFRTPFSQGGSRMSGIEIHANIAYNLLHGSYIRQIPLLFSLVVGLLLAFLCGLFFYKFNLAWSGALFALVGGATLLLAYGLFISAEYYVSPASFLVATGAVFLVNICARYYETYQSAKRNRLLLQRSESRIREILAAQPAGTADVEIAAARKIRVFVSYRHKAEDAGYMAEILDFLSGLRKEGIEFWTDQELRLGDRWDTKIKQSLANSDIALVLVSQAYLDSDYCINTEISSFLERQVTIMPIMLLPCEWQRHAWLSERQFLPSGGETLAEHYQDAGTRQRMFLEIRAELRRQADRLRGGDP
jgi:CHASE2 domain-containing sensor protein